MSMNKLPINKLAVLNGTTFNNKMSHNILKYLDTSSVTKGHFDTWQELHTKTDSIPSRAQRAVKDGTIVISTVRPSLEHYGYIEKAEDDMIISSGFVTLDADETIIDSRYLYYLVTSPQVMTYLVNIANTSVSSYPSFNPDDLGFYEIEYETDINKQKEIVKSIVAIDSKIALNNSICADLESLAKEIYDYWFVQFDFPDEKGNPYKSSGGVMEWNDELKREIPKGWKGYSLKDHYILNKGLSYTSKDIESGNGVAMINLACIDTSRNYRDGQLKYHNGKVPDTSKVKANSLLIACTDLTREREIIGCPILVPNDGVDYTYSTDIANIEFDNAELNDMYMYMTLRTDFYHDYIKHWASGTTVLHLDLTGLDWYGVAEPPMPLQKAFGDKILNFHNETSKLLAENRELTELRDFLLPMLMNGQIKVGA